MHVVKISCLFISLNSQAFFLYEPSTTFSTFNKVTKLPFCFERIPASQRIEERQS